MESRQLEDLKIAVQKQADAFEKHAYDDLTHFAQLAEGQKRTEDKLDILIVQLSPMQEAWNGVLFTKKFLIGLSAVVLAVTAIGGAVYWFISYIRHG